MVFHGFLCVNLKIQIRFFFKFNVIQLFRWQIIVISLQSVECEATTEHRALCRRLHGCQAGIAKQLLQD